jgi:hypothetical protein
LSYKKAIHTYHELEKLKKTYTNLEVNQEFLLSEKNNHLLEKKANERNTIVSIVQNSEYYGNKDNIKKQNIVVSQDIIQNAQ